MGHAQFAHFSGTDNPGMNNDNNGWVGFPKKSDGVRRTVWKDFASRFFEPQDCLASFLALESAEVIAGVKPANLFPIPNRTYACGRNPYQLWRVWGREVVGATCLKAFELTDRGDSALVLLYRSEALMRLLSAPAVRIILSRAGYQEDMGLSEVLDRLRKRLVSGAFPHEIGIFLGYPLKDVVGFMGLAKIPFSCQGPWKIYGNPQTSLRLAETFRYCRSQMAEGLAICSSPYDCLNAGSLTKAVSFPPTIENNIQSQKLMAA